MSSSSTRTVPLRTVTIFGVGLVLIAAATNVGAWISAYSIGFEESRRTLCNLPEPGESWDLVAHPEAPGYEGVYLTNDACTDSMLADWNSATAANGGTAIMCRPSDESWHLDADSGSVTVRPVEPADCGESHRN